MAGPNMNIISVKTSAPYNVVVGQEASAQIPSLMTSDNSQIAIVHPRELSATASRLVQLLAPIAHVVRIQVPSGENAKTLDVARYCWSVLGERNFTRADVVVGLGGGATTDLAGFVASTWLRGVKYISVPTTVLGMVDAAVGGKTGLNTVAGKNLVGAFHEPAGVLCDLSLLGSLPIDEIRSGVAEIIKCGFIADPEILALIESDPSTCLRPDSSMLEDLIIRGIGVKARVVAADLHEIGPETVAGQLTDDDWTAIGREALNYGHTLGHAIEKLENYHIRHGEAIAVGMVFIAELSKLAGKVDEKVVQQHRRVLTSVQLPTSYTSGSFDSLISIMRVDKKTRGNKLRFVVLNELARPVILADPPEEYMREAYRRISR